MQKIPKIKCTMSKHYPNKHSWSVFLKNSSECLFTGSFNVFAFQCLELVSKFTITVKQMFWLCSSGKREEQPTMHCFPLIFVFLFLEMVQWTEQNKPKYLIVYIKHVSSFYYGQVVHQPGESTTQLSNNTLHLIKLYLKDPSTILHLNRFNYIICGSRLKEFISKWPLRSKSNSKAFPVFSLIH